MVRFARSLRRLSSWRPPTTASVVAVWYMFDVYIPMLVWFTATSCTRPSVYTVAHWGHDFATTSLLVMWAVGLESVTGGLGGRNNLLCLLQPVGRQPLGPKSCSSAW